MQYSVSKRMWLNSNRESLCVITLRYGVPKPNYIDIMRLINKDDMYRFGRLRDGRQHIVYQATATLIMLRYPDIIVVVDTEPVFTR